MDTKSAASRDASSCFRYGGGLFVLDLRRPEGVRHQHGDGHGTHTAWNRGDKSRHFLRFAETNIAHQPLTALLGRIRDSIDANINDRCAGFDPIAAHHLGFTNGSNENIRLSYNTRKIPGA